MIFTLQNTEEAGFEQPCESAILPNHRISCELNSPLVHWELGKFLHRCKELSFLYVFYKSIQEMLSSRDDPLRDMKVHFSHFEKPQIY